jgi:hypothetical protein
VPSSPRCGCFVGSHSRACSARSRRSSGSTSPPAPHSTTLRSPRPCRRKRRPHGGAAKSTASGEPLFNPLSSSLADLSPHPTVSPPCRPYPVMSSARRCHRPWNILIAESPHTCDPPVSLAVPPRSPCVRPLPFRSRQGHGRPYAPCAGWPHPELRCCKLSFWMLQEMIYVVAMGDRFLFDVFNL